MEYERLWEILIIVKTIHTSLISRVDFEKQDNKHAIYLIQGGIITSVTNAYKFNLQGYYTPASQQKRLIDEALDLIWFFDENTDNSRQVKAWFEGHVVERTSGNSGNLTLEERSQKNFLKKEDINELVGLQKKLKNITSVVMHPTINVMRNGSSKTTHIFDYDNNIPKKPLYISEDFGSMFINPSLYSLLVPVRHLLLNQTGYELLRSFIAEIEQ